MTILRNKKLLSRNKCRNSGRSRRESWERWRATEYRSWMPRKLNWNRKLESRVNRVFCAYLFWWEEKILCVVISMRLLLSLSLSFSLFPSLSLFLSFSIYIFLSLSLSLPISLTHFISLSLSINNVLGARAKKAEAAAASSGGLESGESKVELIKRPRDYAVTFSFPEVLFVRNFRLYEEIGKNKKETGKREQEKRKKEIEEEKGRGKKGIGKEGKRKIGDGRGEMEKGKGNGIV